MVDQIKAWLNMIPPEERKRWEWLDDESSWFGMSRTLQTPVGAVYNPASAIPDLFGVLGTAVRDPLQANLVEPALGAATYASQLLPSTRPDLGRRKFFSDEPEVPLQGTDFARYWRENRPTVGLPSVAADIVQDPSSYIGGPIGEAATLAARVPGLARVALPVARADELYSEKMGQLIGAGISKTTGLAKHIPGVRGLLEDSPLKAIAQFGGGLGRAVRDPLAADRLEHAATGSKLGLSGKAAEWATKVEPGWQAIDDGIGEIEHPVAQAVLLHQRAKALEQENLLEARFEQYRMELEEGRLAGDISQREFNRENTDRWQQQIRAVRAIQFGLIDTINAVKSQTGELLAGQGDVLGEAAAAAQKPTLYDVLGRVGEDDVLAGTARTALQRASDEARRAKDFGLAIRGGKSGVDTVEGLMSMSMGETGERIAGLQAQDPIYRQARETAMKELNEAADAIFARYKDVTDPAEIASLEDVARTAYQAAEDELAPFTQGIEQTLSGLAKDKRQAIVDVWGTGSNVSLDKQVRKVLGARRAIREQAEPLLHDWYREMGYDLATRTDAVERAVTNADTLLKEPALMHPSAAAARQEIITRLNKYGSAGDVLKQGDLARVAANLTTNAYAKSLGVASPPPWMGAAITAMGAWKELALLSPRYQLANFISQLTLSEADGVPASRVVNLLRSTLPQMKGAILRGERVNAIFDEATSRTYAALRGNGDGTFTIGDEVVGRQGEALIDGATGPSTTHLGRIPLGLRAGVPGLATGGAYWSQNPDDPDRARNALLVGGAAAAFGAATPKFAFYNQQLTQSTETAARGAAFLTGTEGAIGSVSKGTGLATRMVGEIAETVKPTRATSVGKELTRSDMLPGLNTVSGMQDLSPLLPAQKGGILPPLGATADEVAAARTAWTGPLPEGPVLPPLEGPPTLPTPVDLAAMTPEELASIGYQRWDEPGTGRLTVNRPQGLYTTPAGVTSPHEYLGEQHLWRRAPDLNVLSVPFNEQRLGAGRAALHTMLGNDEYYRVVTMSADDMLARVHAEFPGQIDMAQFGPNYDKWDVVEAWAGLEARKRGYDAIELADPARPEYSEFVALTERALTPSARPVSIDVAPPAAQASRVIGLRRTGPSPVATAGEGVDVEAIEAAFRATDGKISPDALEQIALRHGATAEQASALRSRWDQYIVDAENEGLRLSNKINFDYSDVNVLTQKARESGFSPFLTWQTKALPKFATLLLQNPRFIVAIDGLNNLSDEDVADAGLTSRFARLVGMGVLGDVLAEQVLGRTGEVRGNPLGALFPYADIGRDTTLPDDANPLQRTLAALQPFGLSPGPAVTLPLMAAGATGELPVDLFRTSSYLKALSTGLTGREADPELLTKHAIRAARGAVGAEVEPTVTGDFLRDRAIRQRIAEIAVEETGKPPAGPYLLAMDDPASQIWLRARAQVDRQRMGEQAGLSAVLPFRTKFLSDTEAEVRRIREQTGVGPEATAARRTQLATPAERAAAEADIRKKPLKPGETLEQRASRLRWTAAEAAAAAINPLAKTLNSLGGDDALSRQFPEYIAFNRRTKHMSPKRKGQLLAEFLGPRQALKSYLAANNIYG